MKAKKLIKILEENPEAEVTISMSDENQHFFADRIVEVTDQGEKQITIVADINKNSFISDVMPRFSIDQKVAHNVTEDIGKIKYVEEKFTQHMYKVKWEEDGDITKEIGTNLTEV